MVNIRGRVWWFGLGYGYSAESRTAVHDAAWAVVVEIKN
jgi:hypothetical protein